MKKELEQFLVTAKDTIRQVMACIDSNAKGITLVVDQERRLIATVTDGDIRRAILAGTDLDLPVDNLLKRRGATPYPNPITTQVGTTDAELIHLMNEHYVQHIPLLDEDGRVVDIALFRDLVKEGEFPATAVIMAGGSGTRLRPLTEEVPKPMLPVGERPLMEHTIAQLRQAGIKRVNITTHYRSEKIVNHFGDGKEFGIELNYVAEDLPLGTAGALGLMESSEEPLLVINGDILTTVNFRAMLDYHREHRADLTVAVCKYEFQVPYGVVECESQSVCRLKEKPSYSFLVNAGIYLLEPIVRSYIANGEHLDMTDLIKRLIRKDRTVVSFPIVEYWLDIGEPADYERAQEDVRNGRFNT